MTLLTPSWPGACTGLRDRRESAGDRRYRSAMTAMQAVADRRFPPMYFDQDASARCWWRQALGMPQVDINRRRRPRRSGPRRLSGRQDLSLTAFRHQRPQRIEERQPGIWRRPCGTGAMLGPPVAFLAALTHCRGGGIDRLLQQVRGADGQGAILLISWPITALRLCTLRRGIAGGGYRE